MKVANIHSSLASIATDGKVGVKLARLTGDEKISVFAIELAPGQVIPAHYHKEDVETYFILEGQGLVSIGSIAHGDLTWVSENLVHAGDCFTIYPGEAHEFKNISDTTLRIIGSAPLSHTQHDRYFIEKANI